MVGGGGRRQSDAMAHRGSVVAQLLQSVHGGALVDPTPRNSRSRRLSLDSCRHQQGKTRVYVRSKDTNSDSPDPLVKETERLQGEVEEVNRTLTYIRAVVQQGKLEILPRSATLILDTVMNVFNTLRNTPAVADSTPVSSCQAKVYQSLARFINWTDSLLVSPQESFKKDDAREIIDTLSAGIKLTASQRAMSSANRDNEASLRFRFAASWTMMLNNMGAMMLP
ncbi:guanine nucleotide-releasing factor 2-like [Littorina saxatilis]|uniref:guanine nucleotide-releasing factor 2-like n=1 Tax=Littorina saxatilis TaxID=31220 RepID=UPI0038B63476